MTGKIYYKILSAVACVSLLLNSLWGIFLFPQTVIADEATESAELELIEEVVPTPEPILTSEPSPTPLPTPDLDETEQIELQESLPEELEEAPVVEESASLVVSLWVENEGGSVITSTTVGEGVEYRYKDTQTKVLFTKLTEPGYLTIREFEPENAEELGILGKAYEITSDMQNGTFLYDLTLPLSEEVGDDFEIKYAENGDSLDNAQVVEEFKEENENAVTIRELDHFTVFVITNPTPPPTNKVGNIFDNDEGASVYSETGAWFLSSCPGHIEPGNYPNGTTRYAADGTGDSVATWTFEAPASGRHQVYASWSTHNNRATDALYTIASDDGIETVNINQSAPGGCGWSDFQEIGAIHNFTSGTSYTVTLSNNSTGGFVIADAIKIQSVDDPSVVWVDDGWAGYSDGAIAEEGKTFGYNAFATIQDGIDVVNSGGTVNVAAGTYTNDIWSSSLGIPNGYRITKSVTLLGAQAGNDPAGSTSRGEETILVRTNGVPYSLYASDITIDGFMFGSSDANTGGRLIISDIAHNTIVRNNIIQNTPNASSGHGVYIYPGATNALVEYNTFYNTAWEAIASWQVSGAVISNNHISSSGQHAIQMMGHAGSDNEISYNHISGIVSKNAIQYWGGPNAIINHNVIEGENTMYDGIWLDSAADDSIVSDNLISGTIYAAINVRGGCTGAVINFNEIYGNGTGVVNYDSSLIDATNNWWGDASGPFDGNDSDGSIPLSNLSGLGNAVYGAVNYGEWAVNPEFTFYAPVNLGWNIRSESSLSGERPVDLACGEFTNADFDTYGNGKISQNWELIGAPVGVKYQRQWMWPGSGSWSTDGTVYTNDYIPFSTFGSSVGTEGEWNTRVRSWMDMNGNGSLDAGIDLTSGWSNECTIVYDRTTPVTTKPLDSPEDGSFWNSPIQIQGVSTDNFITNLLNLFYKQADISDPWMPITSLFNPENNAVFDWFYSWAPAEGTYDIMAAAVDAAGNEEKSVYVYNVTFDNTQPTITNVSANKDYVKAGDELTITAEVTDASGINAVSADFSYNIGYTDRPQPTSVAMQNVGGNMYKTIYTVPSGWDEGIMYIKVAARDGTGGNWIRSNDQDTVIVDNTAPLIIFEIPENGSTHAGIISLKAVCDEDCNYINFWWRAEGEPYSSSSKRYHYVHDDGTIFEWDLNSLSAKRWDGSTYVMSDGPYYLYAAGKDLAGNWARTPNVQIVVDNTAPLVTIESPSDFSLLRGTVDVMGTLSENVELSHYNFSIYPGSADFNNFSLRLYSDTQYLSTGFANQLLYEWDTTTWPDGDYLLRFAARDKANNRDLSGDPYLGGDDSQHVIRVTVDNTDPTLEWTSPAEGAVISGTTVVSSNATDVTSGVESVKYEYQKVGESGWNLINNVLTGSPYETNWNTTGLALGDYILKATATDNAGNSTEIERSVGVAAVISSEAWDRPGWGEITISWTTDRPTDGRVVYDTVSHSIDLSHPNYGYAHTSGTVDTAPKTLSHTVTISGLSSSTTYYWRTVSGGSPKVISAESRGDTFSIPGGDTGGEGVVAGVVTSATTTPFPYAELEDTSTTEEETEEVLGEETEIDTGESETPLDEAVGILSRTTKGRILAISAFLLGLILYFISRRRRE